MEMFDLTFKKYVINSLVPFPVILKQAGLDGYSYEGKCFCPFHDNYESPAAKMFKDKRGDTIFCFSERRLYHPSDIITRGILKVSLDKIFNSLWEQLNESQKDKLITLYDKPIDYLPQAWKDNKNILDMFKLGEVTFAQHLKHIQDSIE